MRYSKNPILENDFIPVDIVLHPSWWYHNEGIVFNEDFYFHPIKRIEVEKAMEKALYDRWGKYGLGKDKDCEIPQIGAVHLAAGYLLSEMLGCEVIYQDDSPPQVICKNSEKIDINVEAAFKSSAFKKLEKMIENLKKKYGFIRGDVNWSGILNIAMDLRGQNIFMDMFDSPDTVKKYFNDIRQVIEKFTNGIREETRTSSISVNRNVRHFQKPVFLHSECSHVMISTDDYEKFLLPFDIEWSKKYRPYGIHYCGEDPHRFVESFTKVPYIDFLDLGWGGDVKLLRKHLPNTFFNIRLSPVEIVKQSPDEIRCAVIRLVRDSANPWLTGVCCVNIDQSVKDENISAVFEAVNSLRKEYSRDTIN